MFQFLIYFLCGDGHWDNRWVSTHGDAPLMVASVVSSLVLFTCYVAYAFQNRRSLSITKDITYRRHYFRLSVVFFVCGASHLLYSVVSWVIPVNWLIVIATCVNIVFATLLLFAQDQLHLLQTLANLEETDRMARQIKNLTSLLKKSPRQHDENLLAELENLVRNIK